MAISMVPTWYDHGDIDAYDHHHDIMTERGIAIGIVTVNHLLMVNNDG